MIIDISKQRSALMGIATIWLMLFHFRANFGMAPFDYLSSVGYCGVDIFLFLSGFGLYAGYKLNAKRRFYIRRFARFYPTYLVAALLSCAFQGHYDLIALLQPFIQSLGIGYFLIGLDVSWLEWYVPTMYLLYGLFPLYMSLCIKCEQGSVCIFNKRLSMKIVMASIAVIGIFLTTILIIIQKGTIILTTSRIPIFIIGTYFGYLFKNNVELSKYKSIILCEISILLLVAEIYLVSVLDNEFLWRNAIYWLPFALITPGLCCILAHVNRNLPRWGGNYWHMLAISALNHTSFTYLFWGFGKTI